MSALKTVFFCRVTGVVRSRVDMVMVMWKLPETFHGWTVGSRQLGHYRRTRALCARSPGVQTLEQYANRPLDPSLPGLPNWTAHLGPGRLLQLA